jgi:predicted AlkP superfamily pyrophosphatase or phosphodiesterase
MFLHAINIAIFSACLCGTAMAEPVLLISIDGLRPGDVFEAQARGLKIPALRQFLTDGSYATAVVGVLPTLTYPSHTTLLTGANPAEHGIVSNTTFDPLQINQGGWFWYASDITQPTLWDGARGKGMTVANVHWPVSVGETSITWNLPQIWHTGHVDDAKLVAALTTPGLLASLEAKLGKYALGIDETIEADETRGRFAVELISEKKPEFITVYLTGLDHVQHVSGPGSTEAHAVLERIDAVVAKLIATERTAHPDAVIALVSDHGFEATTIEVNLFRPFIDAGLITLDDAGKIKSWTATPWNSGGSIAVILAQPRDAVLKAKVAKLLTALKANPDAHIANLIDATTIAAMGGNSAASFYIDLAPGALAGGFKGKDQPLTSPSTTKGMHGYFPASPAMRSTFMLFGPGIAHGHSYGEIDMRAIAPTLARVMGFSLPNTNLKPLPDF